MLLLNGLSFNVTWTSGTEIWVLVYNGPPSDHIILRLFWWVLKSIKFVLTTRWIFMKTWNNYFFLKESVSYVLKCKTCSSIAIATLRTMFCSVSRIFLSSVNYFGDGCQRSMKNICLRKTTAFFSYRVHNGYVFFITKNPIWPRDLLNVFFQTFP